MLVSAAATGGYAWLVAPLLQSFEANSGLGDPRGAFDSMDLSVAEIVIALVLIGALRALTETVRVNLTAKAQPGIVREFTAELLRHLLDLEPVVLLRWPPGELASRIQVEVHGIRMLLQLVHPGHPEHVVVTALATMALGVDTTLAIPGLLMGPQSPGASGSW